MRPLARDLGIDRRTVERWATGRWQPPRDIWVLILAALQPAAQRGNREARRAKWRGCSTARPKPDERRGGRGGDGGLGESGV